MPFLVNPDSHSIRDFRNQAQHFSSERQDQISKASKALESIEPARIRRATLADYQTRVDEVLGGLAQLRKENDKSPFPTALIVFILAHLNADFYLLERDRLRELRESLAERRRTLSAAKLLPPAVAPSAPSYAFSRETQQLNGLSLSLARARSGLVQELVEVFNVVEVGGRPPIGGKAGTKGEWTIGDLILPVPGDIRRKFLCFVCLLWGRGLITYRRIPARPHQRRHYAYDPLSLAAHVLPWGETAVSDNLVWGKARRWPAFHRRD